MSTAQDLTKMVASLAEKKKSLDAEHAKVSENMNTLQLRKNAIQDELKALGKSLIEAIMPESAKKTTMSVIKFVYDLILSAKGKATEADLLATFEKAVKDGVMSSNASNKAAIIKQALGSLKKKGAVTKIGDAWIHTEQN